LAGKQVALKALTRACPKDRGRNLLAAGGGREIILSELLESLSVTTENYIV
jgi:hypothetical protein